MDVTKRSLIATFFLMLCTFGMYAIYWFTGVPIKDE